MFKKNRKQCWKNGVVITKQNKNKNLKQHWFRDQAVGSKNLYFTSQKPGESYNTVINQLAKLKPVINMKAHHVPTSPVAVNEES